MLWLVGLLTLPMPMLMVMVVFGFLSLLNDAAAQSFLPRLVPQSSLLAANARLDQSSSVAQTFGPVITGALVTALGAPLAVLLDALSYLASGAAVASIRPSEVTTATRDQSLGLRREIGEGLSWVYRHRMLAPLAITTHGWFFFNGVLVTVFVPFALLSLQLNAFELGVTLAAAGVGGLLGSLLSTRSALDGAPGERSSHAVPSCLPRGQ